MATYPDDPNVSNAADRDEAEANPAPGEERKAVKQTRLPRQPGKPTMMQPDEDVVELEPVADEAEGVPVVEEDVLATERPPEDASKEKSKSHVTAELLSPPPTPRPADDVLFIQDEADAERPPKEKSKSHVTAQLLTPQPAPRPSDDVLFGSDEAPQIAEADVVFEEMEVEPPSGVQSKDRREHVLDGEPPGRAEPEATDEMLAGESGKRDSSAINWNEIGADSGAAAKPVDDEAVRYEVTGEGSSHDSLLEPEELARHADETSAVNLGQLLAKSKNSSGIDPLAEALESGVNLDDDVPLSPTPGAPSVDFDDIRTDSAESLPPAKVKWPAAEDDEEAVAMPVEDEAEAVALPAEEDEAVAAPVADEEPPVKARGKAKTKPEPVPVRGPSCLGRLVSAGLCMLLGILLVFGGLAATAFVSPDLIEQVPSSPWVVKKPAPRPQAVQLTPTQRAFEAMATGDFDTAIAEVKNFPEESAKGALGKARALKLLKDRDLAAKPFDAKEKVEMAAAIKALRDGKNDTLADQLERALREPEMRAKVAQSDAAITAVQQEVVKLRTETQALAKTANDATAQGKKIAKQLADQKAVLASVNDVLKSAGIKDTGSEGVAQLVDATRNGEAQLGGVNKALADAKVKDAGAKGVQQLLAARAELQKDRDGLNAAIKAAYDEMVQANVVKPGVDPRQAVAEGARKAREKGESPLAQPLASLGAALAGLGQGAGGLAAKAADTSLLAAQLAQYKLREPFVQTPAQRFDLYAALLQDRNLSTPGELAAIHDEARSVLKPEAKTAPALQAKAHYVTALALRNAGKFDEARKELTSALAHAGAKGAAWTKQARTALDELTDAHAYYLPQIERLHAAGDVDNALAQTDVALQALPGDGQLLAERARLRLEASRAKGKISPAVEARIRGDAQAAIKSAGSTADGEYALGLLEEYLGQYGNAETHFRTAIAAHKGSDHAAARYRAALVRVLLMDRPDAAAPVVPADGKKRGE